MKIKKAVFVVAGLGTRFLPATKAQPKEMLPIVDKPIIQHLVEEAVDAGILDIIFVTGRGKQAIENHFDKSFELEANLENKGKTKQLEEVSNISKLANFAYVRQPVQKGDGEALLHAKPFLDPNEPVLVIFPDYLMHPDIKAIKRMMEIYEKYSSTVICGDIVDPNEVGNYGVMSYSTTADADIVKVEKFVEKPKPEEAPSNLISAGYFILTPEALGMLETSQSTVADGELRLADTFVNMVNQGKSIYTFKPSKPGFDCGSILGFLQATVEFGLRREGLNAKFKKFLKTKTQD